MEGRGELTIAFLLFQIMGNVFGQRKMWNGTPMASPCALTESVYS
jgi:hypothetical protein